MLFKISQETLSLNIYFLFFYLNYLALNIPSFSFIWCMIYNDVFSAGASGTPLGGGGVSGSSTAVALAGAGAGAVSPPTDPPVFQCPRRPNLGREGRPIGLKANHFQISMPRGFVHHYDVNIQPDKCPRKVRRFSVVKQKLQFL